MYNNSTVQKLAIDTHVHLYSSYNFENLFETAKQNFSNHNKTTDKCNFNYVICFVERSGENYQKLLTERGINYTKIDETLIEIELKDGSKIYGLLGKQIITKEKIEVLGLGTTTEIQDGLLIEEVISKLEAQDAVVVLPWGFGKWLGARRNKVAKVLEGNKNIFVGDIIQRSKFISFMESLLFQDLFKNRGVLSGTDPLPVKGEEEIIGNYGVVGDIKLGLPRDETVNKGELEGHTHSSEYSKSTSPMLKNFLRKGVAKEFGSKDTLLKAIKRRITL